MIIELAIALLIYCGAMFWLGTGDRWKWAIPVSLAPMVLLLLILQEVSTFPDAPMGLEQIIIAVLSIVFLVGWIGFISGKFASRHRRNNIGQVNK